MDYDVVIVGAGPAGSTTATYLSESNTNILLLDKDIFPRDKPCGGGIPCRVLKQFSYVDNHRFIETYSYGGHAYSPSMNYELSVNRNTPIIALALRKKFDNELVKYAKQKGVEFKQGLKVVDVIISKQQAKVILEDGDTISTKIIVGADGVWSIIANKCGLRRKGVAKGICILQEFEINEQILDTFFTKKRHCIIHSRFKELPGYGWVFPKKNHLNIGIGCIGAYKKENYPHTNFKHYYQDYLTFLQKQKFVPQDLPSTPIIGAALPILPLDKTYSDRVILVGDAGGFINPLSGEGIYYAMVSGKIAAQVISEALKTDKINADSLSCFQSVWEKEFGKDLKLIHKIHNSQNPQSRERLFQVAEKDKKLADLLMGVITGELSLHEYKWRIIRRYFYTIAKSKIVR